MRWASLVLQPSALGKFPTHGAGWENSIYASSAELRRQKPEFKAAEVAGTFRIQRKERCRCRDGRRLCRSYPWILDQALGSSGPGLSRECCSWTASDSYQGSHWWETLELQPSKVNSLLKNPSLSAKTPEILHL